MTGLILVFQAIFPYLVTGITYSFFGYSVQRVVHPIARIILTILIGVGTYWIFATLPITVFPVTLIGISMIIGFAIGYLSAQFSPKYSLW